MRRAPADHEYDDTPLDEHTSHRTAPYSDFVHCTGDCGERVPDTIEGDPYCDECALALVPEDVRAMQSAPAHLVRDVAALPDPQYTVFWDRLLHEYLADPPASDLEIDALQDAVEDFSQDRDRFTSTPPSLAPAGPVAHPTRLAG